MLNENIINDTADYELNWDLRDAPPPAPSVRRSRTAPPLTSLGTGQLLQSLTRLSQVIRREDRKPALQRRADLSRLRAQLRAYLAEVQRRLRQRSLSPGTRQQLTRALQAIGVRPGQRGPRPPRLPPIDPAVIQRIVPGLQNALWPVLGPVKFARIVAVLKNRGHTTFLVWLKFTRTLSDQERELVRQAFLHELSPHVPAPVVAAVQREAEAVAQAAVAQTPALEQKSGAEPQAGSAADQQVEQAAAQATEQMATPVEAQDEAEAEPTASAEPSAETEQPAASEGAREGEEQGFLSRAKHWLWPTEKPIYQRPGALAGAAVVAAGLLVVGLSSEEE